MWTVLEYRAEIWGWRERREVAMQEKFLRWTLGEEWCNPGYMIRKEVQREKLRTRTGKRAWNFERKMWEENGGELARQCWEEIMVREGEQTELTKWEEER